MYSFAGTARGLCFVHMDKKEFLSRGMGNLCVFGNEGDGWKIFDTRDFLKRGEFKSAGACGVVTLIWRELCFCSRNRP